MHGSKNYGEKSCCQMKISEYAICILKKNALNGMYRYTAFICSFKHPIILANLAQKFWLNYSLKLLWILWQFMCFQSQKQTPKFMLQHSYFLCLVKNLRKYLWKKEFIINKLVSWRPAALLKKNSFTGNIWVQ